MDASLNSEGSIHFVLVRSVGTGLSPVCKMPTFVPLERQYLHKQESKKDCIQWNAVV